MLIPSMNKKEITLEISNDYEIITGSSTLVRQRNDYDRLRRKLKIKKEDDYPVVFEFKTKSKNKWITRIIKSGKVDKYNSPEHAETVCFTYFYTEKGIRVFFRTEGGFFSVFNGHLFSRYKERMDLNLSLPLELVKRLFSANREWNYMFYPPHENGERKLIGMIKEGFVLGEIDITDDIPWLVHKTFINRNTANLRLTSSRSELIEIMKNNLIRSNPEENKELYDDLLRLYHDFGLMENNEFGDDIEDRMKKIIRETQAKNMPETEFWNLA